MVKDLRDKNEKTFRTCVEELVDKLAPKVRRRHERKQREQQEQQSQGQQQVVKQDDEEDEDRLGMRGAL